MSEDDARRQAQRWQAPQRLVAGRYLLIRELGRGGMGVVWLAADEFLGRQVAVKELRPPRGLAATDLEIHQRRALQEARSAARIQHPNAVTLHEAIPASAADDAVYLIMELVTGPTLAELITRGGALPATRVASFAMQLLDVLAVAHALGIVHRDIKPGNVMIAAGDLVKLADFGIAYTLGDPRLTRSGVMGTQAYQAPECFESAPITPAADLWSLGATLYCAAEGHGPFDRDSTGATLRAILLDDLPVPRCDPHLAAAISGLLRRDLTQRASIDQTRDLLRQVPGLPPAPQPDPHQVPQPQPEPAVPPQPTAESAMTRQGARAWPGWDPNATTGLRKDTPLLADQPPERPPARRRPGRRTVIGTAAVIVVAAVIGGVLAAQSNGGPARLAAAGSTKAATSSASVSTGSASGPASHSAHGSSAPAVPTAEPSTGGPTNGALSLRLTIPGPSNVAERDIAYSPNGMTLVTYGAGSGGDAIVWSATTGAFITDLPFGTDVSDVAFSPDGQTLAVAEHDGGIGLWNTSSYTSTTLNDTGSGVYATGVAFSPDGSTLAVAYGSGVKLLDVATQTWTGSLSLPGGASVLRTLLFTPNGDTLAAADSKTGYVYVWDVSTGALIGTIQPPANDGPGLGEWISYSTVTGLLGIGSSGSNSTFPGVRFWAIQSRAQVSTLQYPGTAGVNAIAYDPVDGSALAVVGTNGKVFLWEMPEGVDLGHPQDPGAADIADVAFSPDGKTLAVLDAKDRIFLWTVNGIG